jgi:hypothetical protein
MRVSTVFAALLLASPAVAADATWTTSQDAVNMGDVFADRFVATLPDDSGKVLLRYACDALQGESYIVLETQRPGLPTDSKLETVPMQVTVGDKTFHMNGYTHIHGNIYDWDKLSLGLYQYQQVEAYAALRQALLAGGGFAISVFDLKAEFPAADAAESFGYVDKNCLP